MPFSNPYNKAQAHFKNGLCQDWAFYAHFNLFLKWIMPNWASHARYGPLRWTLALFQRIYYMFEASREFSYMRRFYYPLLINKIRPIILGKRNSPLNTRAEDIRVEVPFVSLKSPFVICYV